MYRLIEFKIQVFFVFYIGFIILFIFCKCRKGDNDDEKVLEFYSYNFERVCFIEDYWYFQFVFYLGLYFVGSYRLDS